MTHGFNANVPARKPRTRIGRVISELTSEAEADEVGGERTEVDDKARTVRDPGTDAHGNGMSDQAAAVSGPNDRAATTATEDAPRRTEPSPPRRVDASRASARDVGGHEQIARLRERLAAASHARAGSAEPKRTAQAVGEMVDGLRARLETSARERADLVAALEDARATLVRAEADLQKERRTRTALEAQAEERRRIADDAVAEAEALAAERDQVLGELAEHLRLEGERTVLLTEVEAALAQRDTQLESAARELAEARDRIGLRSAEVAELETRLQDEAARRARAEARSRELEEQVARLSEAREALESIEAMMTRGR